MIDEPAHLDDMSERSREVFRHVVEGYLASGGPVGSRTLSRSMSENVSAATIRNVMQDLELMGLLAAPHTSAGRLPTQLGLRMFVDGLLEVQNVDEADRKKIRASTGAEEPDVGQMLDNVGSALSGLTQGASLVLTPKQDAPIRHIEFVSLATDRALAVIVTADGQVENRIFTPEPGQTPDSMRHAANYLNAVGSGKTLTELQKVVAADIQSQRAELGIAAEQLVNMGSAFWENEGDVHERLIVRGRSNLLSADSDDPAEIERIRELFDDLERKRDIADFLDQTDQGEGVRIFIGSENKLFSLSGSSLVVSPYMNADRKVIGAVGVIGPTRLNYGRIVPIVDYTAQLVGKLLSGRD